MQLVLDDENARACTALSMPTEGREKAMLEASPLPFINGVFAYHTTVALKAAVELDLFSEGVAEPALLSNSTGISR